MPKKSDLKVQERIQARAEELDQVIAGVQPAAALQGPQTSLADVLADADAGWSFSKDGASGAMLVRSASEPTGGAAIKIEDEQTARMVNKTGQMMQAFFERAEGPAPFAAPRVALHGADALQANPQMVTMLKGKLEQMGQDPDLPDKVRVGKQIAALDRAVEGQGMVLKMEFAQGQQLTKIPLEERVALYKSDAFAQSIGRAMPAFAAMGMDDHLGMDMTSMKNNPANLMFDTQTGQLSAIDFSTLERPNAANPQDISLYTYGRGEPNGPLTSISKADRYLQGALKDAESFEQAVDKLVNNQGEGLRGMMEAFTTPAPEGGTFFSTDEIQQLDQLISMEDKRRFAVNLIIGSAQGLDYLKTNVAALEQATESLHETVKGVELEHIHTKEALGKLCERIERVDTDKLNAQVALRSAEFNLARLQPQAQALQQQKDRLAAKINRLENRPKIMDRLRFLIQGKEKVINQVKDQKAKLDTRSADLTEKIAAQREVKAVAEDQLKELAKRPPVQGQAQAQAVKLRDNAQIADIAAHHPQHEHAAAADDLDEGPHKLREDREMADVVEHVKEHQREAAIEVPDDGKMAAKVPKVHAFSAKS